MTVGDLRVVSRAVEAGADAVARDVDEFDGRQGIRSGEPTFETMGAALRCAQSWQRAVQALGAELAVAADKLTANADAYAANEQRVAQHFGR